MNVRKTVAALVLLGVTGTAWAAPTKPTLPSNLPPAWDAKALDDALSKPRYTYAGSGAGSVVPALLGGSVSIELVPLVGVTIRGRVECVTDYGGVVVPVGCRDGIQIPVSLGFGGDAKAGDISLTATVRTAPDGATFEHTLSVDDISKAAAAAKLDRSRLAGRRLEASAKTLTDAQPLAGC